MKKAKTANSDEETGKKTRRERGQGKEKNPLSCCVNGIERRKKKEGRTFSLLFMNCPIQEKRVPPVISGECP